jgi:FtsH-binding integral membrane protein
MLDFGFGNAKTNPKSKIGNEEPMATRAIRPKRDDTLLSRDWQPMPERAPSIMRVDRPLAARVVAMIGLCLVAIGSLAMIQAARSARYVLGPEWGFVWFSLGIGGLLYHAFRDSELQYRRVYAALGFLLLFIGVVLRAVPVRGVTGGLFLTYGISCLGGGLLFLIGVVRNETEQPVRSFILRVVGVLGAVMILAGLVAGSINQNYLQGEGALLLLLGLFYAGAYVGLQESGTQENYRAGLALGVVGLIGIVLAVIRSIFTEGYLVPSGYILISLSLVYVMISLGTCSEIPLVALIRRELSALFYSPIA